ncbi:MAG: hypothetical protein ACFFFH_00260 [Candidatus Thorarchaeota archaeon]
MFLNDILSNELRKLEEIKKLRIILKLDDRLFDYAVNELWHSLKQMKSDLILPTQTPIEDLVHIFKRFEEIRMVFSLKDPDYSQLNELLVEITAIKAILKLPDSTPLPEVLSQIKPEQLPTLGLGNDSLLQKMMLYSWLK